MRAKRETLEGIDAVVLGCMACRIYGVEGDSEWFERAAMRDDDELERQLRVRAIELMRRDHAKLKANACIDWPENRSTVSTLRMPD